MLSLLACSGFSDFSDEEIKAIAEHVPQIVASGMDTALLQTTSGTCLIKLYLLESIELARSRGHFEAAGRIEAIYRHFNSEHPGADPARTELLH